MTQLAGLLLCLNANAILKLQPQKAVNEPLSRFKLANFRVQGKNLSFS